MRKRHLPIEESYITLFTGPRGGGKSLTMSIKAAQAMTRGYPVWSNYPISFEGYHSLPLDKEAIYRFSQDLRFGFVAIDEFQLWLDSRRSMTTGNALINAMFAQIRKRSLSLMGTVKNFHWLDVRVRYETDIVCDCRDASKEQGGHELGIKKGELFFLYWRDMSGSVTGRQYYEQPITYFELLTHADRFWHIYNTFEEYDTISAFQKVKVEGEVTHIGSRSGDDGDNRGNPLAPIVEKLRAEGITRIASDDFWSKVRDAGIDKSPAQLHSLSLLRELGVEKRRTVRGMVYAFV